MIRPSSDNGDNLSPLAFGEVSHHCLRAGLWDGNLRLTFWRWPGASGILASRITTASHQAETELSRLKTTSADVPKKISMKSSDMDELSRCAKTSTAETAEQGCSDVCSPLKVHSKSVAKRFFSKRQTWGQERTADFYYIFYWLSSTQ